jgi:hypothetical protein
MGPLKTAAEAHGESRAVTKVAEAMVNEDKAGRAAPEMILPMTLPSKINVYKMLISSSQAR